MGAGVTVLWYLDNGWLLDSGLLLDGVPDMTIAHIRALIADPAGEGQTFSDAEIQAVLDRRETSCGHDTYAAAADILEMWAAKEKLSFDVTADGQTLARSQKVKSLLELAALYRQRQLPTVAEQVRSDVVVY